VKTHKHNHRLEEEIGTIRKSGRHRLKIALVYPNRYAVGMSNLGFQTVYRLFNALDAVVCERAFVEDDPRQSEFRTILTVESRRPLKSFDIIAFSISFENDFIGILHALDSAGLPLRSHARQHPHPLVIAGGVACSLNPAPLAPFVDCFLIGEAEELVTGFTACLLENGFPETGRDRISILGRCARQVPGTYVPSLYRPEYHPDGTLSSFTPLADVPSRIHRAYLKNLSDTQTCSVIVTPGTTFDRSFLVEVGRGCPHGCRFCSAGFVYRPPRFRSPESLQACVREGSRMADAVGLVGAAVSDLPGIRDLCRRALAENVRISFSSLRADALDDDLLAALRHSNVKTATLAPDAGSERMRRVINKGITEADVLRAAERLVTIGIANLKLYFMVGLPTETPEDVAAVVRLVRRIKHVFLKASRNRGRIGEITVSLNSFVPKPFTPFQWAAMDDSGTLKHKLKRIKDDLRKVPNVRVHADLPRWAYIQALLSRGDRRVAEMLLQAFGYRGNWPRTLKESPLNADFYVVRPRKSDERFAWDFIDHGVRKSFLRREYERALQGQSTPPCPMKACADCNICRPANEDTLA
jgi:radical SAM superfamily enzyme YgiQ (UPF0313 family)